MQQHLQATNERSNLHNKARLLPDISHSPVLPILQHMNGFKGGISHFTVRNNTLRLAFRNSDGKIFQLQKSKLNYVSTIGTVP